MKDKIVKIISIVVIATVLVFVFNNVNDKKEPVKPPVVEATATPTVTPTPTTKPTVKPTSTPTPTPTPTAAPTSTPTATPIITPTPTTKPTPTVTPTTTPIPTPIPVTDYEKKWRLMLVNADNPVPKEYDVKLVKFGGHYVSEIIYPYINAFFKEAKDEGITISVTSGYRSVEEQNEILEDAIQTYIDDYGKTREEGMELALTWIAKPGHSEHNTGICLDIKYQNIKDPNSDEYKWVVKNAEKYEFILRYPENKTDITGIIYEPWHYRYVGVEAAKYINSNGLCLEEYINIISE